MAMILNAATVNPSRRLDFTGPTCDGQHSARARRLPLPILPRGIVTLTIRSDPNVLVLSQAPLAFARRKNASSPLGRLAIDLRGRSKEHCSTEAVEQWHTFRVALLSRFGSAVFFRLSLH